VRLLINLMLPIGTLIVAVIFIVGLVLLIRGHGMSALPPLLIPLVIAGFCIALITSGMRSLDRRVQPLLADVKQLLDAPQAPMEENVT
jgi:hypothetical protein